MSEEPKHRHPRFPKHPKPSTKQTRVPKYGTSDEFDEPKKKSKSNPNKRKVYDDPNTTPVNKTADNFGIRKASKLTPEVEQKICDVLMYGGYLEDACAIAGISKPTLRTWLLAGARGEPGYDKFLQRVNYARSAFQIESLKRIREAGMGEEHVHEKVDPDTGKVIERNVVKGKGKQWTADAWRLERLRPHKYGQRNQDAQYIQKQVKETFLKLVKAFSGENNEHLQRALEAIATPDMGDESFGIDEFFNGANGEPGLD